MLTPRNEIVAEAHKICREIEGATRLGGGFAIYTHEVAPDAIAAIVDRELRAVLELATRENPDFDFVAVLKERLIP